MSEEQNSTAMNKVETPVPEDEIVTAPHTIRLKGQTLSYTTTTGTIILKEESEKKGENGGESEGEKPRAAVFFIAYTLDDVTDCATRPITFSFNGGPGSSSVWLHMGLLGPKRVLMDDIGNPTRPPYKLVENEFSLLAETDLVFIDPVSTGYSRPIPGEKAKMFHGFKKDIESVGDFIRLYVTRYERWSSPKYLVGESYGTTRSAGLSGYLQDRHGMFMNGIMLVSSVLDFSTLRFTTGNDLPYILFLPTYTATAWYHKQLPPDLQTDLGAAVDEARQFATGEYTLALMKGAGLSQEEQQQVAEKLARLTGLTAEYIQRSNLRIHIHRFCKELLRDERRVIGRLDSRFKGIDRDAAGEYYENDPSLVNIMGPYTGTFNDYVRRELKYQNDLPYEILTSRVHPWSYAEHQNQYVYVAETLRQAMSNNPYLRVHIANGFFDLATPFLATEYTFDHLMIDESLRSNISISYYEAGHMMYIHLPSLEKLSQELAEFIRGQ